MKTLTPFLLFPGNCREALNFYRHCLGGEIVTLETFGDSPMDFPDEKSHYVFNSEFRAEEIHLRASDNPSDEALEGRNFALFVKLTDETELRDCFAKLSEEGQIVMPFEGVFGMLRDRFGVQWMLALQPESRS